MHCLKPIFKFGSFVVFGYLICRTSKEKGGAWEYAMALLLGTAGHQRAGITAVQFLTDVVFFCQG